MASAGGVRTGIAPEPLDRALGFASIAMLALVLAAIARGHAHWGEPPAAVWGHLALVIAALVLTPVMMLRTKGSDRHRLLGTIWVALLLAIAIEGFFIPLHGRSFSPIWLISLFVLWRVPTAFLAARRHQVARHRAAMRGTVIGAFVVAGLFTLPFGRMLGIWLFHG
ncbi:DUF2306 domain-containing protein [Sphingomonas sp. CGMCC 1.13654]|uniref:DUF2306 domain-containing protein n=1 Tax=Sphingomonas chungangi TaxID=2683589 RepID=A0A838L3N8_9SPHN|nr:DUF2306 domain-containing protein [Sphingomonas chungangi]MBA2932826.1 DUF2306 domain-containing protein [Sphingomonas chungangi]